MRIVFTAALFVALTSTLTLAPAYLSAHSKMDTTTPADGASMGQVPEFVTLDFSNEIRLTKVVMTHLDQPSVALDLGAQKSFLREFRIPMVGMGKGSYRIEWRGLGKDGHAMQGSFAFDVH